MNNFRTSLADSATELICEQDKDEGDIDYRIRAYSSCAFAFSQRQFANALKNSTDQFGQNLKMITLNTNFPI